MKPIPETKEERRFLQGFGAKQKALGTWSVNTSRLTKVGKDLWRVDVRVISSVYQYGFQGATVVERYMGEFSVGKALRVALELHYSFRHSQWHVGPPEIP